MGVFSHSFRFAAGATKPQEFWFGPSSGAGTVDRGVTTERPALMHTLRVGFLKNAYSTIRWFANIDIPDAGMRISGIEVPFVLPVEAPMNLQIVPEDEVPIDTQVLAGVAGGCCEWQFMAQRTDLVVATTVLELEPWCAGVKVHNPGSACTWRDASGAVLGVFAPNSFVPRPRLATQVLIGTANSLVSQLFTM